MEKGLTKIEALSKLRQFGRNEIIVKKEKSILTLFLFEFPSFINAILFFAALFSIFVKDYLDGFFIFAILILNAFFGFIQRYKAEKSLEKLKSFVMPLSRVIRDGKEIQIETAEIVPGDLVVISEGERIPADGSLTLEHHIEIDESILTGESFPVIKKHEDLVFSGTLVVKGRGEFLVKRTGMETKFGEIAKTLAEVEADKTPLQKKLDVLGKILSLVVVIIAVLLLPVGLSQGRSLFPLILLAVSIGIAAIPEGLPTVVTVALSIGTNRMAKKNAIVREMQAVETLGAVQILLTDKTGTLTQNSMKVKKVNLLKKRVINDLLKACVLGNTATLVEKEDESINNWDIIGDKTDGALLSWAKSQTEFKDPDGKVVDEYVFDPTSKTITVVWQNGLMGRQKQVFVRGAVEVILEKSILGKKEKEKIRNEFETWAKEGLRVIGFGTKIEARDGLSREQLESNLNFLGFIGIYDPPRIEAKEAVLKAKKAGIQTIMITGDNEWTAQAIAKEVGLIEKDEDVITGEELRRITDRELEKIILKIKIYARTRPEDKLRLVNLFKKLGFVVGVTGDGVNDALALKRADVGIAMGESGTDVAKEASDIILTDDNYSTLIRAIDEGRTIYDNIIKAITYLLSGNLAELSLIFSSLVLGLPAPLLPTQILWINLVTDSLPAIALASDTKDPNVLRRKPRDPKEKILNKNAALFISVVGFGLAIFLLIIFDFLLKNHSEDFSRMIVFNLLIFIHLLIPFFVRGKLFLKPNRFLILTVLGSLVLQAMINLVPGLQTIFHLGFN